MNKHLIMALALPSVLFYQTNAPILYSDLLLVNQVREEQGIIGYDLASSGNELIIFNDPAESSEASPAEAGKQNQQEPAAEKKAKKPSAKLSKKDRPGFSKKAKNEARFFSAIEQKFIDLPTDQAASEHGESELVRMLGSMSGTIFYGIKLTNVDREDYIFF